MKYICNRLDSAIFTTRARGHMLLNGFWGWEGFRLPEFFAEQIIVGPHEGETLPLLAQMVLTQCTSISELLVHPVAPPGGQI